MSGAPQSTSTEEALHEKGVISQSSTSIGLGLPVTTTSSARAGTCQISSTSLYTDWGGATPYYATYRLLNTDTYANDFFKAAYFVSGQDWSNNGTITFQKSMVIQVIFSVYEAGLTTGTVFTMEHVGVDGLVRASYNVADTTAGAGGVSYEGDDSGLSLTVQSGESIRMASTSIEAISRWVTVTVCEKRILDNRATYPVAYTTSGTEALNGAGEAGGPIASTAQGAGLYLVKLETEPVAAYSNTNAYTAFKLVHDGVISFVSLEWEAASIDRKCLFYIVNVEAATTFDVERIYRGECGVTNTDFNWWVTFMKLGDLKAGVIQSEAALVAGAPNVVFGSTGALTSCMHIKGDPVSYNFRYAPTNNTLCIGTKASSGDLHVSVGVNRGVVTPDFYPMSMNDKGVALHNDNLPSKLASSVFDLSTNNGNDKYFTFPHVANTAAITSPVEGLCIYDLSTDTIRIYANAAWRTLGV